MIVHPLIGFVRLTLVAALRGAAPVVAAPEKWEAEIDHFTAAR